MSYKQLDYKLVNCESIGTQSINFCLYKWTYEAIGLLQSKKLWKSMSEIGALIYSAVWTLIWVKEDWWLSNK